VNAHVGLFLVAGLLACTNRSQASAQDGSALSTTAVEDNLAGNLPPFLHAGRRSWPKYAQRSDVRAALRDNHAAYVRACRLLFEVAEADLEDCATRNHVASLRNQICRLELLQVDGGTEIQSVSRCVASFDE
jgi:hypothetical protein